MTSARIICRGEEYPTKQKIVSLDEDRPTLREWVSGFAVGAVCFAVIAGSLFL